MSNTSEQGFGRWRARLSEYRRWARAAQAQTGKSLFTQCQEIRALARTGGQCGVTDYYWFKLYDEAYLHGRGHADFIGWRQQTNFSLALNPRSSVLPAWDKSVFLLMASAGGLPVAPVEACYHPADQVSPALGQHLRSREDVAAFFRNTATYPLFGKPVYSQQGVGSAYLAGYDKDSDALQFLNGQSVPVDSFLQRMDHTVDKRYHKPECGFLFQAPLKLAPELQAVTRWPAICSVRVVCLNGPDGVQPIRAVWKVALPPNHVDNFSMGAKGNLVADVDLETGEVGRVVDNLWPHANLLRTHPVSGQPLQGLRLPGWQSVLDICRRAGAVFPLMKIHHWDIALTDQGPQILELNDLGGTEIPQMHGRGLLTEYTRAFLKRHANPEAHPWIKAL